MTAPALTPVQRRVLLAAQQGRLTYSQFSGSHGARFEVDGRRVGRPTIQRVCFGDPVLIAPPTLGQRLGGPIHGLVLTLTPAGLEALA